MGSDSRTDEQRTADDNLTEAVNACLNAYDCNSVGVLVEYLVIAATQMWDQDGDGQSAVATCVRDGNVPIHRLVGLCDYALTRYRKLITED